MNTSVQGQIEHLASQYARLLLAELPSELLTVIERGRYRHIRLGGFLNIVLDTRANRYRISTLVTIEGRWLRMSDRDLRIGRPLASTAWIRGWLASRADDEVLQALDAWCSEKFIGYLSEAIRQRIRNHPAFTAFRHRFVAAYCPDQAAHALCIQIHGDKASGKHYLEMVHYLPYLKQLEVDNPNLFALLLVLLRHRPDMLAELAVDGYSELKAVFRRVGVPAIVWRLASRYGSKLWSPIQGLTYFRKNSITELKWLGYLLQDCGQTGLPPPELLRLWYSCYDQVSEKMDEQSLFNPLFKLAWRHWRMNVRGVGKKALLAEIGPVVASWAALIAAKPAPLPKNASWASAKRRIQTSIKRHLARQDVTLWPVPPDTYTHGEYLFEPIRNTLSAFEAGLALRNCLVATTCFKCPEIKGLPHYLLRREGKLVGVLRLDLQGSVTNFLGFGNRQGPAHWWHMAESFALRLRARYPDGIVHGIPEVKPRLFCLTPYLQATSAADDCPADCQEPYLSLNPLLENNQ